MRRRKHMRRSTNGVVARMNLYLLIPLISLLIIPTHANWNQFHGNSAKTGRSSISLPNNLTLQWKTQVGCLHWGANCWIPGFTGTDSSPSISPDGTTIYIGSYDHNLYAIHATSGVIQWKYNTDASGLGIESSPAVTRSNIVIVGTYSKQIIAVNGTNGQSLWNYTTLDYVASAPVLGTKEDVVFVGGVDGLLYGIYIATGKLKFTFNASTVLHHQSIWGPPMLNDNKIYFGAGGAGNPYSNQYAHVHCLHETNGSAIWNYSVGSSQIQSSLTMDSRNTTVFVGVYDGRVLALDVTTGELRYQVQTKGRVESSPVTFMDSTNGRDVELVIVGSADGYVYAWNVINGTEIWKSKLGKEVGSSAAVDATGKIFIGGDTGVYGMNGSNGKIVWKYNTSKLIGSSPAILDSGGLVVGGEDGYLYKFV